MEGYRGDESWLVIEKAWDVTLYVGDDKDVEEKVEEGLGGEKMGKDLLEEDES